MAVEPHPFVPFASPGAESISGEEFWAGYGGEG
jgi:hypothetical protein